MWLLLFILPTTFASIQITITSEFDGENSDLYAYLNGNTAAVITDNERAFFNIEDHTLKEAINSFHGAKPNHVYVKSPTPWGDLYKTFKWNEITRHTRPFNANLVSLTETPEVLREQIFENKENRPIQVNVALSKTVEQKLISNWTKIGDYGSENIAVICDIDVKGSDGIGNHDVPFGKYVEAIETEILGDTSEINLLLQPRQAVRTQLIAKKGTVVIEIEYEASLTGTIAANYAQVYRGHHFYQFDVNQIVSFANLTSTSKSIQSVEISIYYDAKIIVSDNRGIKMMDKDVSKTKTAKSGRKAVKTSGKSKSNTKEQDIPEPDGIRIVLTKKK